MGNKNQKEFLFIQRLFIWLIYILSGYLLYSRDGYLFTSFITFAKLIYPLSIFWIQIRLKRRSHFLPISDSMTTSQLWFNILPVFASLITVVLTLLNAILFLSKSFL